jgi:integrase
VPKPEKSEKPRDRALSVEEVKLLWDALDNFNFHQRTVSAVRLLLALGGQRVEEVLDIHVSDVDFASRLVTLCNTKNGSTHVVPFGDVAEKLLQERLLDTNSVGALFGKVWGKVPGWEVETIDYDTLSHAIKKLCPRIHMNPFVPKDIRRTVKTLMGFAGIRKEDRDRFQNHAMTDVSSRHYDRYDYLAEKRQVMVVWDAYLKTILAGSPQTNVVQLRAVGE